MCKILGVTLGLILDLYDRESQLLTLCCMICGASDTFDMSSLDEDDEGMVGLEHKEGCFVAFDDLKLMN